MLSRFAYLKIIKPNETQSAFLFFFVCVISFLQAQIQPMRACDGKEVENLKSDFFNEFCNQIQD